MTPACMQHPDIPATWQLTLYERAAKEVNQDRPKPMATWRGFACDGCIEAARTELKRAPVFNRLLLLWRIKA